MLATINYLIFPVFLFAAYLSAASVILYNPKEQHQDSQDIVVRESETSLEVEVTANNNSQEILHKFPVEVSPLEAVGNDSRETRISTVPERAIIEIQFSNNLHAQAERIINNLNKRQSRKLCKPLGIQQKHGKVEKTLTFIKAEIRSLFKDNPERVIAAIQERLPELISMPPEVSAISERMAS
jgi:hypothetical protein